MLRGRSRFPDPSLSEQVVLASMTSKLSHRKRTVRRVASRAVSSGTANTVEAPPPVPMPSLAQTSGGWDHSVSPEALTTGSRSDSVSSPSTLRRSKAKSVLRALRNPFKADKGASSPNSGASTPATPRCSKSAFAPQHAEIPALTERSVAHREQRTLFPDDEEGSGRLAMQAAETHGSTTPARLSVGQGGQPVHHEEEAPSTPLSNRPPRHSNSMHTLRSTLTTTCREASLPTGVPEPKSGNFPHQHLVSNLQHFARYSSAAYGQSFLRIFGIAKHEFKFPHTEIHANNHAFAHHVGIHVEDILLSSFTDPGPTFATDKISQIVNYGAFRRSGGSTYLAYAVRVPQLLSITLSRPSFSLAEGLSGWPTS